MSGGMKGSVWQGRGSVKSCAGGEVDNIVVLVNVSFIK
jgi:hypothetical protein